MAWRRPIWLCLILCCMIAGFSANAQTYAFAVFFSNKNGTPYTVSSPAAYLSPRALARRSAQGIAVDSTDLPVAPQYLDSVVTNTNGFIYETSKWLNLCVVLVHDSAGITEILTAKPYIDSVVFVAVYGSLVPFRKSHFSETKGDHAVERTTGDDPTYYSRTWDQTSLVQGNCLHDSGYNGSGKLIAVLDAGFINALYGFDSLWADGRVVDMHNFTYDTDYVFGWDDHGTFVLSQMAGYVPDTFVGSAPLASYALYITEYDPDDQPLEMINMLAASERADSLGADIITESLGYDVFLDSALDGLNFPIDMDGKTTYAARAANIATKKGMLFVATAGNDGGGYETWGDHITTPGDADSALTIGAVEYTGTIASFSGFGPNTAGQVKPDVCAMGVNAAIINYPGYNVADGTSFSTPQIAGWAACLWQAFPNATPAQLRNVIDRSANLYTVPGAQTGYGIPDFCTAMQYLGTPILSSPLFRFEVIPNPFLNSFSVSATLPVSGKVDIAMYDVEGRKILDHSGYFNSGINAPVTFEVAYLPAGIYILKATTPGKEEVVKLVKE